MTPRRRRRRVFHSRSAVGDRQRRGRGPRTAGRVRVVQHRHARPSDRADGGRRRYVRRPGGWQDDGELCAVAVRMRALPKNMPKDEFKILNNNNNNNNT